MWGFDGEYKRKPKQSLSGKSRAVDKQTFLSKLKTERELREAEKKQERSALIIQACFRGHLCRQKLLQKQRDAFDAILLTARTEGFNQQNVEKLITHLLQFFKPKFDYERLLVICQQVIREQEKLSGWISSSFVKWKYLLPRLVSQALKMLSIPLITRIPFHPIALRLLEIVISPSLLPTANLRECFLVELYNYLLRKGYYAHLTNLLISKVPEVYVVSSNPPTILADCLMNFILEPFTVMASLTNKGAISDHLYLELCVEVFAKSSHPQIRNFVLPSLLATTQFDEQVFNGLLAFIHSRMDSLVPRETYSYFLLSILRVVRLEQEFSTSESFNHFLCIVQFFLEKSSIIDSPQPDSYEFDSDSDEETKDCEPNDTDSDNKMATHMCIQELESPDRVTWLLSSVEKYVASSQILISFAKVFHCILVARGYQVHKCRLLYGFVLKRNVLLRPMWTILTNLQLGGTLSTSSLYVSGNRRSQCLLQSLSNGYPLNIHERDVLIPLLSIFSASLSAVLATLHDSEFIAENSYLVQGEKTSTFPFSIEEVVEMSKILRDVCVGLTELAHPDVRMSTYICQSKRILWMYCYRVCVGVVRHLHLRDTRRAFCSPNHWVSEKVFLPSKGNEGIIFLKRLATNVRRQRKLFSTPNWFKKDDYESGGAPLSIAEQRYLTLLQEMPFVLPFETRMTLFRSLIFSEREEQQSAFLMGPHIDISIRRTHLYEDAYDKLSPSNESNLRLRMRVRLINTAGLDEAGIDGGGVSREFLSELLKSAFDPNRGFFLLTHDNTLYPNPSAHLIVNDFEKHFYFIGRMIGKALYENMLVEIPLAGFFLSKLLCGSSHVEFHYLDSLDPELCRHLLSLKTFDGNIQDLGLDFTVLNADLGQNSVENLIPNGENIPVTNQNCIEYIYRMADYKLNKQIAKQCQAFKEGVFDVIESRWLRLFSWKELQMLISGAVGTIDMEDLKTNTKYAGEYNEQHPNIINFWRVVFEFDEGQRQKLIKFVTSCSRPPLLGFKELYPPFSINPSGSNDRLPSASTCMNLLKLPDYTDEISLRHKLLYAINSSSGFELS